MQLYIDQSGKVEYTSKHTVVAYSNAKQKSLRISARNKREIQQVFREAGKPDMFVYKTFAILIYLLIVADLEEIQTVIVDTEYVGYEPVIKNTLLKLIRRKQPFDHAMIQFQQVGKKHSCHAEAIRTFRGEKKADITVSTEEVLKYVL